MTEQNEDTGIDFSKTENKTNILRRLLDDLENDLIEIGEHIHAGNVRTAKEWIEQAITAGKVKALELLSDNEHKPEANS